MQKEARRDYPPIHEWKWRNYNSVEIDVEKFINSHKDCETFYIGTDSRVFGPIIAYTTVIVAYKRGRGGSIVFFREKVQSKDGIRRRLLIEAMRSVECAWFLEPKIKNTSEMVVHLDINSNLKYESSNYLNELVGLVVSQGFNVEYKPNAWAATTAAHGKVRK